MRNRRARREPGQKSSLRLSLDCIRGAHAESIRKIEMRPGATACEVWELASVGLGCSRCHLPAAGEVMRQERRPIAGRRRLSQIILGAFQAVTNPPRALFMEPLPCCGMQNSHSLDRQMALSA